MSLLFVFTLSCNDDLEMVSYKVLSGETTQEQFATVIDLKGENFGPERQFGYLTDILVFDSSLVLQDIKKNHAFWSLKNLDELFLFQKIGLGLREVKNSEFVKVVSYDEDSNEICFFDYSTKFLNKINVRPDSVFYKFGSVPGQYWGEIQSAVGLNDSLIAVTGRFSDTKFTIFNNESQRELIKSEYKNSFPNELSEETRVAVSPTDIKFNKKHGLVVLNKSTVNSIDTYSTDGKPCKFYSFGEMENISVDNTFSRDYFYYYSVKTDEDIVYGLYLGLSQKVMALQDIFVSQTRPELHVYNLITDKLQRFKLDRLVNVCVIDAEKSVVYCIEEDNEDQPLVRYEIPKI